MSIAFRISPNAVFETFGDEVMVINMVSGSYFALDQTALGIWEYLQANQPLDSIIAATQTQYRGDPAVIADAVKKLVEELESEDLIVRLADDDTKGGNAPPATGSANEEEKPVFQAPVLSKFTDMQDLLLLDPIHEVDEAGWPHAKAVPQSEEGK